VPREALTHEPQIRKFQEVFLRLAVVDAQIARRHIKIACPRARSPTMETLDLDSQISANRRGVSFIFASKLGAIECMISRALLEAYFWLPPHADDARMLKTFTEGANRIRAIAHRKLLARPTDRLEITRADLSRG
jgi:hypothetical protein